MEAAKIPGHGRQGAFDTLRLAAALTVFHTHSFAIAGRYEVHVPGYTLGSVAVIVFFAMSGYWVSRSALERSLAGFAVARTLRIVPGLFVCCLATIAVCALATSLPVDDYLRRADTWSWLGNALPFWLPQQTMLPGVFLDGAYQHANGSLWTLPYEVFCYLLVACAAVFGPKGMRAAMAATGVFVVAVMFGVGEQTSYQLLSPLNAQWLAIYAGSFFLGAWLNDVGDRTLVKLVAVSAVALLIARDEPVCARLASIPFYSGAAIWIGRNLDLDRRVTRGWDLSYGVYIYAFPCQQVIVRALPPRDAPGFALYYAAALGACVLLAALSWVLIEKPSLKAKALLAGVIERGVGRAPLRRVRTSPAAAPVATATGGQPSGLERADVAGRM